MITSNSIVLTNNVYKSMLGWCVFSNQLDVLGIFIDKSRCLDRYVMILRL